MSFNRKGFTLIELIIVVIIIGILAAIAAPMMSGNVIKAKRSEAVAALGALRTAQRCYFAEKSIYVSSLADLSSYVGTGDINGKYFNSTAYSVTNTGDVSCNVTKSTDTAVAASSPDTIKIDVNGVITGN